MRIITLAPNAAEVICALGACEAIVGVSKFCVYPAELANRPRVGGLFDPDLERIAALRPDLVVVRGRSPSVEALCRARGIALHRDETETLAGLRASIRRLGVRLKRAARAGALIAAFDGRLEAIRDRVAGRPRPRVMVTISRRPDRLSNILTAGRGTFVDEMIDIAGGVNVFGGLEMAYPEVSRESILARRPEVIIEFMPELEGTAARRRLCLREWEQLRGVPAVASGRVYLLTEQHCLIPSPRYVEIIEKVSRLLHPGGTDER